MVSILKIENIFKDFSKLQVLTDITMEVLEGEKHVILGPNGAGKTTLFNIITGLYKPSSGSVFFLGKDITRCQVHKIVRSGLSRSFQSINVFPRMTVYENIRNAIISKCNRRFNCISFLANDKKIKKQTFEVVVQFSLSDVQDVPAIELSYGRQRYLELALTAAVDPLLIMLDEPTAGLNSEETMVVVQLIKQMAVGKTLTMVEHDMDVVFKVADRITVLNNGMVLATGSPNEIRENKEVKKAYLGRK